MSFFYLAIDQAISDRAMSDHGINDCGIAS